MGLRGFACVATHQIVLTHGFFIVTKVSIVTPNKSYRATTVRPLMYMKTSLMHMHLCPIV
jgi:hypothetical protein